MKKLIINALFLSTLSLAGLAQRPVVTGVSPTSATVESSVTITGSNLPAATEAHVQFGAAKGTILESSSSQIKVKVPAGSSYEGVTVTNLGTGQSDKSSNPFLLAFGGSGFSLDRFATEGSVTGQLAKIHDLCSCDFNLDGKVDAVTSYTNNTRLSAFQYSAAAPYPHFITVSISAAASSKNVICGDLDGDGKPDLAMTGTGVDAGKVTLLKNISAVGGTISFGVPITLSLPVSGAGMLALQDLNSDGRPDLIITNSSANVVTVFRNASSPGFLSFDNQGQNITIPGLMKTQGLSLQDLDGDGKADLAVTGLYESNLYVLRNTSSGNTISFAAPNVLTTTTDGLVFVIAADLNGDGKADLAATDMFASKMMVWLNNSSSGSLQFSGASIFDTGSYPWGIAAGDLDGDGKAELVVSHIQSYSLKIFANTSSGSTLTLTGYDKVTDEKGQHVKVVDYSGDGKPDIGYTGTLTNTFRVLRNTHCVVPKLSLTGSVTLCTGQTLNLQATQALQVTYKWTRNGTALSTTGSLLSISEAGDYAVTITSTQDGCSLQSEVVRVISGSGSGGNNVVMEPITAVCVGGSAVLKATAINGASYVWSGPNGFTTTTTTASHTLTNVQTTADGSYSVVIKSGDCQFTPAAQSLTVHPNPQPEITATATAFCSGTTATLQTPAGFASYQWKLNGNFYTGAGATTTSITTNIAGSYSVTVSNSNGCTGTSAVISISQTQAPVASFTAPDKACRLNPIAFKNTSTFTAGTTPTYLWDFGDGTTSTEANPSHTYTAIGSYPVTLEVSYGSQGCKSKTEPAKTITVVESPAVDLILSASPIFCPGDSVRMHLEGDVVSVLWNTGATTTSLWAKEAGTYTASVTTSAGCVIDQSITLSHLDKPQFTLSASANTISRGESVELKAEGDGLQYEWEEAEGIVDRFSHTVTVAPLTTTTYRVKAWGSNGCPASEEITIVVDNSLRINPPKIFVPAVDSNWTIKDIELYPELSLTIVNSLGRTIYQASPYTNTWDGTERGRSLEAGVYYYIFKEGSSKVVKTGSITLLR